MGLIDVSFFKELNLIDTFIVGFLCFMVGFFAGDRFRKLKWSMLDWQIMKWNDGCLGYRLSPSTVRVKKNEKVFIALKVETDEIPSGEGIQLFTEE
tara:strand:+ start:232 stop:519 length:288 start_codon:yes stop_codon:yes gene_type:complete